MRVVIAVVALVLIMLGPTHAQAPPATTAVPLNASFKVVFTHTGVGTTGYRLFIDGAQVGSDVPVSALTNGEVTFQVAGVSTTGTHRAEALAFGEGGESPHSGVDFYAGPPPAPGPLRIQIVTTAEAVITPQPDGSLRIHVERVEASVR
jgi:hypothetical protein